MSSVNSLQLGPSYEAQVAADKIFYLRLTVKKMHSLRSLSNNIYGPAAIVAPNLTLW